MLLRVQQNMFSRVLFFVPYTSGVINKTKCFTVSYKHYEKPGMPSTLSLEFTYEHLLSSLVSVVIVLYKRTVKSLEVNA